MSLKTRRRKSSKIPFKGKTTWGPITVLSWAPAAQCQIQIFWLSGGLVCVWRLPLRSPWAAEPHRAWCGWWAAGSDTPRGPQKSGSGELEEAAAAPIKRWIWSPETLPGCLLWFSPDTSTSSCCPLSGVLWPEWRCSDFGQSPWTEGRSAEKHHTGIVHQYKVCLYLTILLFF